VPPSCRRKRAAGNARVAGSGWLAPDGGGYQVVDSRKQIWTIGRPPLAGLARDQHGLSCIELASWCIELAERRTGTYLGIRDDVKTLAGGNASQCWGQHGSALAWPAGLRGDGVKREVAHTLDQPGMHW
jgi:hypothetical protein